MNAKSRVVLSVSLFFNGLFLGMVLMGFKSPNVLTSFNADVDTPQVAKSAFVHEIGSVIGAVEIGERVYVAPTASVRGDEGQPIHIGNESNVQDSVVVHGLETHEGKEVIAKNQVEVGGKKYSVYIGDRVSMAHQSQVHGPAKVGDDAFIGMQALVFKAEIGGGTVVEPGAKVIGVKVGEKKIVPAGAILTKQADADALAAITDTYPFKDLNKAVVHVNTQFADGYNGKKPAAHGH
ncbi:MAG TPA: carbonic anhydrase [Nitrospiria bacterium]|nr:carbonic anhydrase [Nitrospiria bacterium]